MSDVAWPPGGRDPRPGDPDQDAGPGPYADPDAEPHPEEPGVPAPRGGGRRRTAAVDSAAP